MGSCMPFGSSLPLNFVWTCLTLGVLMASLRTPPLSRCRRKNRKKKPAAASAAASVKTERREGGPSAIAAASVSQEESQDEDEGPGPAPAGTIAVKLRQRNKGEEWTLVVADAANASDHAQIMAAMKPSQNKKLDPKGQCEQAR